MNEQVVAIYCFLDDFLNILNKKDEYNRKMKDSEILTTAFVSGIYFGGNMFKACSYMRSHQGVKMIDKSGFNRRLHSLTDVINNIFFSLGNVFKSLNLSSEYIIDSFPVKVCHNIRIPKCKLLRGEKYRGKCVSKREYFYGFKVHLIVTKEGLPVEYFISAGSFADITAFKSMNIALPEESKLYGDNAYEDYDHESKYKEIEKIELRICRKSNSKRRDTPWMKSLKIQMRKRIETVFSCINRLFSNKIHAVTAKGFILKIVLFLLSYSITKALNI